MILGNKKLKDIKSRPLRICLNCHSEGAERPKNLVLGSTLFAGCAVDRGNLKILGVKSEIYNEAPLRSE